MSHDMRFPTMWYLPLAKALIRDLSLCWSLDYSMTVKLLVEQTRAQKSPP